MAKGKIAPSAEELAARSEHHQGPHLDPADRDHFWHKPADAEAAPAPEFEPRWLHKRHNGAIVSSVHVTSHAAHKDAVDQGFGA